MTRGKGRGFASMSPERRREASRQGGIAVHEYGTGHKWTRVKEYPGQYRHAHGCRILGTLCERYAVALERHAAELLALERELLHEAKAKGRL